MELELEERLLGAHRDFGNRVECGKILPGEELSPGWSEVVGNNSYEAIYNTDFGLGDMSVSLIVYSNGLYEVGVGEALRPYRGLYFGRDPEKAVEAYISFIKQYL